MLSRSPWSGVRRPQSSLFCSQEACHHHCSATGPLERGRDPGNFLAHSSCQSCLVTQTGLQAWEGPVPADSAWDSGTGAWQGFSTPGDWRGFPEEPQDVIWGLGSCPLPSHSPSCVHGTPPLQFTKCVHRHYHIAPKRPLKTTINLSLWLQSPPAACFLISEQRASGLKACQSRTSRGRRGSTWAGDRWRVAGPAGALRDGGASPEAPSCRGENCCLDPDVSWEGTASGA